MGQDSRLGLHFIDLPILALNHLVQLLDPGGRLALRETCSKLKHITDACGAPTVYLGSDVTLGVRSRFMMLSRMSEGVHQLDVACCNSDLRSEVAEALQQYAAEGNTAWKSLRQLRCHFQQMVLVKALVECAPTQLTTISISGRRGNWQHAGLLLQQLVQLPSLSNLELALPAQHKLEDYLAQLTQLKSLKLLQAPRSHAPWPLQSLGQTQAKVDPDFWRSVLCTLTQLTSLQLRLPLTGVNQLDMAPLRQLQQLQVCVGKDNVADLIEEVTALTALTCLSIDGKVGRRLSFSQHQAMMNQQHQIMDLQAISHLTALKELQLNLHSVQDLASFIPLTACKQLTQIGCAKIVLQLPWRAADLSPGSVAAADAAEERLLAGILAGQQELPVASVLLARPAGARLAGPLNVEGMTNVTFPLLPQLQQLRVMTLAGKLPLAVLAPNVTSISMQGKERLWSHRKGSGDDMDALFAGMQLVQAEEAAQPPAAAVIPAAAAPALVEAAGDAPGGAAVGPAVQQQQEDANHNQIQGLAANAGAGAAAQAPPAPPAPIEQQLLQFPPPPPPPPGPPPLGPFPLHGGPIASRARAAVAQAERLLGLKQLQALDVSFTQMCGVCAAAGGRALLEHLTSLTVLMRGTGRVRGGVPIMPHLRRLEFYDDGDLKMPGRLAASYDQKEDHQLWVNQSSVTELVLAGSFMLGGFFDGAALLNARKQFTNLKRWVFKDCLDLSIGHLASLLAIKVASTIVVEGMTVLSPSEVRTLISLNPDSDTQLIWSAHVPPSVIGPYRDRYTLHGQGWQFGGLIEDEIFAAEALPPLEILPGNPGMVANLNNAQGFNMFGAGGGAGGGGEGGGVNQNQVQVGGAGNAANVNAGQAAAAGNAIAPNAAGGGGNANANPAAAAAGPAAANAPNAGQAVEANAAAAAGGALHWWEAAVGAQQPAAAAAGANQAAGQVAAAAANVQGAPQQQQQLVPALPQPAAPEAAEAAALAGFVAQLQPIWQNAIVHLNQALQGLNHALAAAGGLPGVVPAAAAAANPPVANLNQPPDAAPVGAFEQAIAALNGVNAVLGNQQQQQQAPQQVQQQPAQQQQQAGLFGGGVVHIGAPIVIPAGQQGNFAEILQVHIQQALNAGMNHPAVAAAIGQLQQQAGAHAAAAAGQVAVAVVQQPAAAAAAGPQGAAAAGLAQAPAAVAQQQQQQQGVAAGPPGGGGAAAAAAGGGNNFQAGPLGGVQFQPGDLQFQGGDVIDIVIDDPDEDDFLDDDEDDDVWF